MSALTAASALADEVTVRVTHRFDWRRWVNDQYQGLVHGYAAGSWKLTDLPSKPGWKAGTARYYLASESRRDNLLLEKAVEAEVLSTFRIDPSGRMVEVQGGPVPLYRNFPAPLPAGAGPGSVWEAEGEVAGDFLANGQVTRVPILVQYRWTGQGTYAGQAVDQVAVKYALRYQAEGKPDTDPQLKSLMGSREGQVSYRSTDSVPLLLRETTRDLATAADGKTLRQEGILLSFFEEVPALGTPLLAEGFRRALTGAAPVPAPAASPAPDAKSPVTPGPSAGAQPQPSVPSSSSPETGTPPPSPPAPAPIAPPVLPTLSAPVPDVKVEADPRGVKLTLENLKFVADQAVLLPGEEARLAAITSLLKTVGDRRILVVGHTAAVGSVETQESLSVARAQAIVDRLKAAGLPPSRLFFEGRGGTEPLAPNDTEAHKAQNRRVEILVLDQ